MNMHVNKSGFSVIAIVIVIAVVGIVGFVGYSVYDNQNTKTTDTVSNQVETNESAEADDVDASPEINSTSDLDKAVETLDKTDPSGSNNTDASQIDSELSNF